MYDYLLTDNEEDGDKDIFEQINPQSLVEYQSKAEAYIKEFKQGNSFQFLRQGYFVIDPDTTSDHIVVNRIVGLRDTWAKMQKK